MHPMQEVPTYTNQYYTHHVASGKGGTGWLERDITTVMVVGSRVYLFYVKELNLD